MDKQKKFAKSPLLYIHQPDISHPKAKMQSNYVTKKNNKEPEAPKLQKNTARPRQRDFFSKHKTEGKEDSQPEEEPESKVDAEEQKNYQTNKKFNEMTIQEKIDYFINKPENIPRMKCEVKTAERTFRGIIQDAKEDKVLMHVGRRTGTTEISVEVIQDIRLLGF